MSELDERDIYVITKRFRGERVVERHFVHLPHYNEKGWYRDSISMGAFKRRMQKRHIKTTKDSKDNWLAQAQRVSFHFRVESKHDFDEDQKIYADLNTPLQPAEIWNHKSLREFYEHIGYDPKTNKLKVESVLL